MTDILYVPFPRELYEDIIRFSDGKLDPAAMAAEQLENLIERTIDDVDWWGDRWEEVAERYAPAAYDRWADMVTASEPTKTEAASRPKRVPLVWKMVTVPAGAEVRMNYGGSEHLAKIAHGKIVDLDEEFSPSEWASKVAGGTSRSAWRDLWFRFPGEKDFVAALVLRRRKEKEQAALGEALLSSLLTPKEEGK